MAASLGVIQLQELAVGKKPLFREDLSTEGEE
jgi:hypothetical protein